MHHLVRARRDDLQVDTGGIEVIHVRSPERPNLVCHRRTKLIVGYGNPSPAVRTAVSEQVRLIRIQALRRADVPMNVDDHPILRSTRFAMHGGHRSLSGGTRRSNPRTFAMWSPFS